MGEPKNARERVAELLEGRREQVEAERHDEARRIEAQQRTQRFWLVAGVVFGAVLVVAVVVAFIVSWIGGWGRSKDEAKWDPNCNQQIEAIRFTRKGEVKRLNPGLRCQIRWDVVSGSVSLLDPFQKLIVVSTPSMRGVHCNPCNIEYVRAETDSAEMMYSLWPIPRER